MAVFNRRCGVDVQEISPAQVKELFPLCDVSDILAGFYVKDDGRVNPVDATAALAKGARQSGCTIAENTTVEEVLTKNGRVSGVRLSDNHIIQCEYVVNATGMWARQFAEQAGISIPNQVSFRGPHDSKYRPCTVKRKSLRLHLIHRPQNITTL